MSEFKDKIVAVFGGSSGLGLEMAKGFALKGSQVIITGRNREKLVNAKKMLDMVSSHPVFSIPMNVSSKQLVDESFEAIKEKYEVPDIVICSAGIHLKTSSLEMTEDQWKEIIDVNLNGTYHVNLAAGKYMVERRKGVIINIASLGAKRALSNALAYCVSKSGVEMLTKCLAVEWALCNVRVNAILPGVFKTDLNKKALSEPFRAENILRNTPIKRFGKLEEIVSAAFFLASEKSGFVTGVSLPVDGGFLAFSGF